MENNVFLDFSIKEGATEKVYEFLMPVSLN
jgi:hypothetical protein